MWQFSAALNGYVQAHSTQDDKSLSADEKDGLWALVQEQMGKVE